MPPHLSLPELIDLCRRWKIARLEVFGSALRDDFGPGSDIDLLYTLEPNSHISLFDLDDIERDFQALLGRKVDLVARNAVERSDNCFRRKHILSNVKLLYAA